MELVEWNPEDVPDYNEGFGCGCIQNDFNLMEIHGEREMLRHGFVQDIDGDGKPEIITRTMNANRARAMRLSDASTIWVSPDIAPPPEESVQISDIDVGDLDEDGTPEVLLASYQGDVICLDATDGSLKWHRRLDYLINNSSLKVRKIAPGPGKNIALTVAEKVERESYGGERPRYNHMVKPSLLVLNHRGETEFICEEYAPRNSAGHYTWPFDIDNDGYCEIGCCGEKQVVWFDNDGARLFSLPSPGEGGHPDHLWVCNWDTSREGREIIYLNGTRGVKIYSCRGELVQEADYPKDVASHLQWFSVLPRTNPPELIASNIRAADSKLLRLNHDLEVVWGLKLPVDLMVAGHLDWDSDGEQEIVCGGTGGDYHYKQGPEECSLHVLNRNGSPACWHKWPGHSDCFPIVIDDVDGDGREEIIATVGSHDGPEGRFSLPETEHVHLLVIGNS
ncbi:MAG: FG-GAP repeat domain-containing protein [Candidatus Brocadiia bacterium]